MSWNHQMQTDKTIPSNEPGVVVHDNEKRPYPSIENAVVGERSVMKREAEKFLKYKDRAVEIQRMWNVKT